MPRSEARARYTGTLAAGLRSADPQADRAVRAALREALRAGRRGDPVHLAAARGDARAAVLRGAFAVALRAIGRGEAERARTWLLIRDFRTATRFTRPVADATLAVARLGARRTSPGACAPGRGEATFSTPTRRACASCWTTSPPAGSARCPCASAEAAAQAAGYFAILADRYREDRGAAATSRAQRAFARMRAAATAQDASALGAARRRAAAALTGFTAAPLSGEEAARRAQQLLRFLALVPVEYGRGVTDGKVTKDFEIQEAVAFHGGARAALADLQDQLTRRSRLRTAAAARDLDRLGAALEQADAAPRAGGRS